LEINRAKKWSMRVFLMGQFCSSSRQTTKEKRQKEMEKKKEKKGECHLSWAGLAPAPSWAG
jgi:hypothetical protein